MTQSRHLGRSAIAACGAVIVALASGRAFVAYRRHHLRWGATTAEVEHSLPGDDLIVSPSFALTRAITIDAAPGDVWPWIVQIGCGRAGFYSYDLIDNLGRPSAEQILPEWQDVTIGSIAAPMSPFDDSPTAATSFVVGGFETNRWMLWVQPLSSWVWSLESIGEGRTRLVTRVRCDYNWPHPQALLSLVLMEAGDFPMMRKQLLGIKRRAEEHAASTDRADSCESTDCRESTDSAAASLTAQLVSGS